MARIQKMAKVQINRPIAVIETGLVPKPRRYATVTSMGETINLTETMRKMKVGQSFRLDEAIWRRRATATASHVGIKVSTTKMADGKILVTRVE